MSVVNSINSFKRPVLQAAAIALIVGIFGSAGSRADTPLTLDEAMGKTASAHPQLRSFPVRNAILNAERAEAALRPEMHIGLELENLLGESPYSGTSAAEMTLSLAGVLERGGKREARLAVLARQMDSLSIERTMVELDLLAEVTRRYLDWLEATRTVPLTEDVVIRQRALVDSLQSRFKAGASPQALVLAAEAELARLEAERVRAAAQVDTSWRLLAMMWQEKPDARPRTAPTLTATIPTLSPLDELLADLLETPDIEYFAALGRIRDAEYQLIETRRRRDIDWQLGVRRLNEDSAAALVAGFSIPIGTNTRVNAELATTRERTRLLASEREATLAALQSTLVRVYAQIEQDTAWLQRLERDVLPRLQSAAEQGAKALAAGALTYADQVQMQREVWLTERERLMLRLQIHRHLTEIQRLVAKPILQRSTAFEVRP